MDARVDPAAGTEEEAGAGEGWAGAPLRSTLAFLAVPGTLGIAIAALDLRLPSWALYGAAVAVGLVLVARVLRDPEWLLAVFVLYIPLSKQFVVPLAPGLNATNALLGLMVLAWLRRASGAGRLFVAMPNSRLVGWWGVLTSLSVVTASFTLGPDFVLGHLGDVKGWLDHFVVFFAFLHLIRDGAMARRVVLYMMIGGVLALGLGFQEWLDKRWLDSIEKARLLGPQRQPNDFGAFMVYISGPFIGLFLTELRRPRAWLLVPYLVLLAKMLLATFSRGALIGMAAAGVAAGWVRGRAFLLVTAALGVGLLAAMPELLPESLSARMSQTRSDSGEELDASSRTRVVLWKAAVEMSLESPLLGKGFKAFPHLKGQYTEIEVEEADNHNMFLYVSSQMGIPALLLLLWLLYRTFRVGVEVYRAGGDTFRRAAGMGAAAMVPGLLAVNMFGSRMTDVAVIAYFWIYLAALAHLRRETEPQPSAADARDDAGPWPLSSGPGR